MLKIIKVLKRKLSTGFGVSSTLLYVLINLNYREVFYSKPIYFFNHIPKCGGTSLVKIFDRWFVVIKDYPPHDLKYPDMGSLKHQFDYFKKSPKAYLKMRPWQMICGHFHEDGTRLFQRYPAILENERVRLITFLRDPFEHRVSLYYHGVRKKHNYAKGYNLKEYLFNEINSNFYAKVFGCTIENYQDILNRYFFIGILEDFDASFKVLAKKMGKSLPSALPHINVSLRDSQIENLVTVMDEFRLENALDYLIYEYCKNMSSNQR